LGSRFRIAGGLLAAAAVSANLASPAGAAGASGGPTSTARVALPPGAIRHILVIDLENESEAATFGGSNTYLTDTLLPQGELLQDYYATGHVSADNYIAQVSGQAPNLVTSSDCIANLTTLAGSFNDITPGNLDLDQSTYPGQVDGQGCVHPAAVQTIGTQLDSAPHPHVTPTWREYAEDRGHGQRPRPRRGHT
jgi:hypothetical protein